MACLCVTTVSSRRNPCAMVLRPLVVLVSVLCLVSPILALETTQTDAPASAGAYVPPANAQGAGAATGAPAPPVNLADILQRELAAQQKNPGDVASTAYNVYCQCPRILSSSPQLCASVTRQCRSSLCMPICTRMAWTPRIEVHCDRAPQWKWCPRFKKDVMEAETAVTAQFQAHTCLQLKLCNKTEEFIDWIENFTFGQNYPNHRLPIRSCTLADEPERAKQAAKAALAAGRPAPAPTPEETMNAAARKDHLCNICRQVIDVNILRGSCVPANSHHADVLQEGSLQDRCLYVADVIGSRASQLLSELKSNVCSCLGCCGTGVCYFPNIEKQWLNSLISNVQSRVKAELKQEGWHFEL